MIMDDECDITVIRKVLTYCSEVDDAAAHFGRSLENFRNNAVFRNAVSMPIMQIGELTKHLSDKFMTSHNNIPWQTIRGMRNWFAHNYHGMDVEAIWKTVVEDVPVLREFCEEVLKGR